MEDPLWQNGSFLVFRRLAQDVGAFHADTDAMAAKLSPGVPGVDGAKLRTFVVGREPDGRSLMRPGVGPEEPLAKNHFFYASDTQALALAGQPPIPGAERDTFGTTCPFWAHVRKVNPRDGQNDLPTDTQNLQMLRRGVPFGPPYCHDDATAAVNHESRGLLFLAYQRSIGEQFEKLNSHWMNQFDVPAGGGHDLLVGMSLDGDGEIGLRQADWPASAVRIVAPRSWVLPTGGAYLFAPSLGALRLLAMTPGPG